MRKALQARWNDLAGVVASVGCAIHCAAMPFVLTYLPSLGLSWLSGEVFHRWMALVCSLLAAFAFLPGWRRHGRWTPAAFGTVGVAILTSAAFAITGPCCTNCPVENTKLLVPSKKHSDQTCPNCVHADTSISSPGVWETGIELKLGETGIMSWLTPLGGALLIAGHLINHRCSCGCCEATES
jgi:hypothetical protein